ncbi:MAG: hypothetical protein ABI336_02085, partial [Humibacillus sp.]
RLGQPARRGQPRTRLGLRRRRHRAHQQAGLRDRARHRFRGRPHHGRAAHPPDAPLAGRAYAVTPPELALPGSEFTAPRTALAAGSSSFSFCVQVGEKTGGLRPALAVDGMGGVLQAPVRAPAGDELVCTPPVTLTTP